MKMGKFGSGGLHLRITAFTDMFICFVMAFGEPATALMLALVCAWFLAEC